MRGPNRAGETLTVCGVMGDFRHQHNRAQSALQHVSNRLPIDLSLCQNQFTPKSSTRLVASRSAGVPARVNRRNDQFEGGGLLRA